MVQTDARPSLSVFKKDQTERLACRSGDLLIWSRIERLLSIEFKIVDLWTFRDGDHVSFTNRIGDLPAWFDLHPLEAAGSNAFAMMRRLAEGWEPGDPCDGPNIWRIRAGDRVFWLGNDRPGLTGEGGILLALDFWENALGVAQSDRDNDPTHFSEVAPSTVSPETVARALNISRSLGEPRVVAEGKWALG